MQPRSPITISDRLDAAVKKALGDNLNPSIEDTLQAYEEVHRTQPNALDPTHPGDQLVQAFLIAEKTSKPK
jgi:hypothetical protein